MRAVTVFLAGMMIMPSYGVLGRNASAKELGLLAGRKGGPEIDRQRTELDTAEFLRRFLGEPQVRQDPARRMQRMPGQVGINPAPEVYLPEVMQAYGGAPWPNADFEPPPPPEDISKYPRFKRKAKP